MSHDLTDVTQLAMQKAWEKSGAERKGRPRAVGGKRRLQETHRVLLIQHDSLRRHI